MKMPFYGFVAAAFLAACSAVSLADTSFPKRPVTFVVSTSPGAGMDLTARLIADHLSQRWNQPVVVENRPGGLGSLALSRLKGAQDDHTFLVADIGVASINPSLYKQPLFEPREEMEPITDLFQTNFLFLVRPDRYDSLEALMKAAKEKPDALNYGSAGVGSGQRLSVELFKSVTRTPMTYIPYRGNSEAIVGLVGGEVDLVSVGLPPVKGYLEEGKLKALVTTGQTRTELTKDVPTLIEATGVATLHAGAWVGLFTRPGTSVEVVKQVQQDVAAVMQEPKVLEYYKTNDYQMGGSSPEALKARMESDRQTYQKIIESANITLD